MEVLLVCAFTVFVTYDLINSWKVLLETKRQSFRYAGLVARILLFIYVGFEIFPTLPFSNLRASFRGWYDLGYVLLTTYSVYDFVIWVIMSFSRAGDDKERIETVQYGFRHVGFLLIGTCVACYLTILINLYLFPPVGVSFIEIFWILIYFIFFLIAMIRMIWGETIDFRSMVRILFSCVMGLQLLFFIMFTVDRLIRLG